MTPCQLVSGVLLIVGCLYAAKGRTTGLQESEQRIGALVVYAALAVIVLGLLSGH